MITISPIPTRPKIMAAFEQLESGDQRTRDAAIDTLRALLEGATLAQFLDAILNRAEEAAPWWQVTAASILTRFAPLLSPAGIEFCERLRWCETPTIEDARDLCHLRRTLVGEDS